MTDPRAPTRRGLLQTALGASTAIGVGAHAATDPTTLRDRLARDPLRPRYHLLPPAGWTNDPNGPVWFAGRYHLFYQYNPKAAEWGHIQWGHAVSVDMIHWQHQPIALSPTPGGADADGVFSGTAVVDGDRVHMMYTGVRAAPLAIATIRDATPPLVETQCLATATDGALTHWTKRGQPVIAAPPPGLIANGFRDPAPWRQGDWWYMVLGSGAAGRGGAILLYRSRDLIDWHFVRIFAERRSTWFDAVDPWEVWECPDFFALRDRHVLIFSARGKAYWQSGRLDTATMTFNPDRSGILDYGSMYAPKTQLDAEGRRILWGWVQEARPPAESLAAGWSGMMTLPRVLTLDADGELVQTALPGLAGLRGAPTRQRAAAAAIALPGCCAEALFSPPADTHDFEITIGDGKADWLTVSRSRDWPDTVEIDRRRLPLAGPIGAIRAFIDGSVIELSIDGRILWTKRFYYDGGQRDAIWRWKCDGLVEATAWPTTPISRDRLTR